MEIHGPALRVIRERTGLTVTELASRVGIKQAHLSLIEAEKRRPSPEVTVRLAQELKVDLAAILRGPLDGYEVTIRQRKAVA